MMELGWVVATTDYVGVGTPGPSLYLVAQSEVRDLVNAVRAARNVPATHASNRYVTFGHSQGGHTSIWSGHLAPVYAPELDLLGVAAAAPALELSDILGAQWDGVAGWVLGPDVAESWPVYYPDVQLDGVLTQPALNNTARLADECIEDAAIEGLVRQKLGQRYFAVDPGSVPAWAHATTDQTPAPMPAAMPVFIAQGTADDVVLPWPNAIVQESWCKAGSAIALDWMGGVSHTAAATTAGPEAVVWIADRFAGRPAPRTCDVPPPVPAEVPVD
jgi:alpha-beta hydrolase superfamily lysophospholipase